MRARLATLAKLAVTTAGVATLGIALAAPAGATTAPAASESGISCRWAPIEGGGWWCLHPDGVPLPGVPPHDGQPGEVCAWEPPNWVCTVPGQE